MAHTNNPSYLGGRDQEDQSWKPAQEGEKVSKTPSKSISQAWYQSSQLYCKNERLYLEAWLNW
jgi:hypothetical protein